MAQYAAGCLLKDEDLTRAGGQGYADVSYVEASFRYEQLGRAHSLRLMSVRLSSSGILH